MQGEGLEEQGETPRDASTVWHFILSLSDSVTSKAQVTPHRVREGTHQPGGSGSSRRPMCPRWLSVE